MNFEQAFKNIDNALHTDSGCSNALDYVEQSSWILFLKYLEDLEDKKQKESKLTGKPYKNIISEKFAWSSWAAPKDKDGKINHNKTQTGEDLIDFVNLQLFPYLKNFSNTAESADTIEYKIGEIFSELKNKIASGYTLRDILNTVDNLEFKTQAQKHELSALYENRIGQMGNSGRNGGEYYTPRALIRTIIKSVNPQIGEIIYDPACGSAGFLTDSFTYLKENNELTPAKLKILQEKTFYGKELKSLAYIIGIMNMILHGIDSPNILHTNTLEENILDFSQKDRVDVILANPPFGAATRPEIKELFPIKTGETALLFMQHFMKKLKAGGRAGIVIKNTFLSNTDNASVSVRKELLENFNLETVLDLPGGVFQGAGVKTVVLFFTKGEATKNIWHYQLNLERNLGKTNPLNEKDMAEFLDFQKTKKESENSWNVKISSIDQETFDLSVKNPNAKGEAPLRPTREIIAEIKNLDKKSAKILEGIERVI